MKPSGPYTSAATSRCSVRISRPYRAVCVTSAGSGDLFRKGERGFVGTAEDGADSLGQFARGEQAVGLDHLAFAMHPFGFDRVEPGALDGQGAGHDAHARARVADLPVVSFDPAAHLVAGMPGGIVPH